jgi:hypothetical protein
MFDNEKAAEVTTLMSHKMLSVRERPREVRSVRAKSKSQSTLLAVM